jgi:hypothetical protein
MIVKPGEGEKQVEAGKAVTPLSVSTTNAVKKRREHYVPRFYLDLFGESLFVFDKFTAKIFSTTSKNIALETGFYDLDPDIDLEAVITENENRMRGGLNELVDNMNPVTISLDARIKISLFIALQYVRTKEFRASIQEAGGKLATEFVKSEPQFKGLDFKILMKDEMAQVLQAQILVSDFIPQVAYILGNSLWMLLVNRTKVPFWTSDNPVALYNPISYGDLSGVGFAVRGIQTHFPLNSKLLLTILDPRSYAPTPVKIIKNSETVFYENEFQVYNATRFVVSSKDDFSMAKKFTDRDENLRKPREQVAVRKIEAPGRSIIQLSNKMIMGVSKPSIDGKR